MEGLWRALQTMLPAERQAFLEIGVKDGKSFQAAYPLPDYLKVLEVAAKGRFGHLSEDEGYLALGHLIIAQFENTIMGKAIVPMLRLIGPKRSLLRIERYFRTINNFTTTEVRELGPNHFEVALRSVSNPGIFQGALEWGGRQTGAKDFTVKFLGIGADRTARYDITWA